MEILIIGSAIQQEELQQKFGDKHSYKRISDHSQAGAFVENARVVFDFVSTEYKELASYQTNSDSVVFVDVSFISLSHLRADKIPAPVFGFCGMPTFIDRELLEVSLVDENQRSILSEVCKNLGTEFQVVADKVGLVTPRVICMIINEAYYTFEEGTASREDIDQAMKLGTNYPWGPFEWSKKIGTTSICHLLDSMFSETGDIRYKVCESLRNS